MKHSLHFLRRAGLVLALPLALLPSLVLAASPQADSAARHLAMTGLVPLQSVGPYVELGTYQIQVSVKLGQPDARLADGTWLYHHRQIEASEATGTVVIRFTQGKVSDLFLATPAIVAALTAPANPTRAVATNQH